MKNKLQKISLCILLAFLLQACGERKINNQPPQIFIADLQFQGEQLQIQLQVRNINFDSMPDSQITFDFKLEGNDVFRVKQQLSLSLDGRGTEQISWKSTPNPGAVKLLQSLSNANVNNLNYQLNGELKSGSKNKGLDFKQAGKVFAVPGKPGHYRLAGISGNTRLNHDRATGNQGH